MLVAGLLIAAPVLLFQIRDTTGLNEDLRDTDENSAKVSPERAVAPVEGEKTTVSV